MRYQPVRRFAICPLCLSTFTALLCMLGIATSASATSFGIFGTSPLTLNAQKTVSVGDIFAVDIGFKLDPGDSISSYSMSVEFDTDLGNELELVGITQPALVTGLFGGPLTSAGTPFEMDSTLISAGSIMSFAGSTTVGSGIVNPSASAFDVIIGTITFKALSGLTTDGPDAFAGFFALSDHLNENSGTPHPHLDFGDLSVNLVPTPTALSLFAVGGALATRRRRCSGCS